MPDIDRALAEISEIRSQLAAGTLFQGFGPAVIALTGGLAILAATAQSFWPMHLADTAASFVLCWTATASLAAGLISAEMVARAKRHHAGLADAVIVNAIEQFLPSGVAGLALAIIFLKYSPDAAWTLPGIWQVLVALGLFAAARSLPRRIRWVAAWYFLSGACVLILASFERTLAPWMMGVPFAVGQFAMAAILHHSCGEYRDRQG